jgi:hypothetical protein
MSKNYRIFRELDIVESAYFINKDVEGKKLNFVKDMLPYTLRDLSVQREGVWDELKRSLYASTAVVGFAKLTPIHLVDLKGVLEVAKERMKNGHRDHDFIALLENQIAAGNLYAHLDGGNRCDDFVDFYGDKVEILEGDYVFADGEGELIKENMKYNVLKKKHPLIIERINSAKVYVFTYTDITVEERAELFNLLNAGENLNPAERRNPKISKVSTGVRDDLVTKYKELLLDAEVFTYKDSKRFGTSVLIGKMLGIFTKTAKGDKDNIPAVPVGWIGSSDLDAAWESNSPENGRYKKFVEFFEGTYIPYINIIDKEEYRMPHKNLHIDFFYLLKLMESTNYELPKRNKKNRDKLINEFINIASAMYGDKDTLHEIKEGESRAYHSLYKTTGSDAAKKRLELIKSEYFSKLIDDEVIVYRDPNVSFDNVDRAAMFSMEGGDITSTNEKIKPGHAFNGKKFEGDHVNPRSKGGETVPENGKLETPEYNNEKSDKVIVTA